MKYKLIILSMVFLNISCSNESSKRFSADSFLKETYTTREFLKKSLSSIPEGATLKTPADKVSSLDVNWPGDTLISSVEKNQPWKKHSDYHFVLDLNKTDLFSYNQTGSYTMTAAILLDFYFGKLEDLGFVKTDEPYTLLYYPIQFISNTWFKANCNITVTGNIYINIEDKIALVSVDVYEIYQADSL